ncbi:MAG: POTRA domain-containing protein, partial [Vulcanimicrobiota bacterium]
MLRVVRFVCLLILLMGQVLAQQPGGSLADPPDETELKTRLPVEVIQVTGNTLVTDEELQPLLQPYQGTQLSVADLEALAKKIEQVYRDRGFFLVNAIVPTQESVRGVLLIQVLEGRIENVVVEGNDRYPTEFLTSRFRYAVPAEGATTRDFQRGLFLLNELPDVQIKAVLGGGEP